ncbi:MAG: proline iminopeptidase-family hydrolase [Kordiimonadaceae bacterium]|jgi:L-proline amide hydrolase|nr:proline iminopeptidase-family hydrolase [Kordiimonadaceae bacterium]MBT6031670.1 proline iminopeptidase-family hydrolase [Kordiimonadaceae bacterium]
MKFLRIILLIALTGFSLPSLAHEDPDQSGYIQVDGGKLWYRMNGIEHLGIKPAIIVMHGGPGGTHRGLMPYVELADTYPVILYDQLGNGKSAKLVDDINDQSTWTVEHFVKEISQIRAALNLDEVIIAGHSWGGTLSAEYAVKNEKGLRAAIFGSPLISTPQWVADNREWITMMPQEYQDAINKHEAAGTFSDPEYREAESAFYARHMCPGECIDRGFRADAKRGNRTMYQTMWGPSEFTANGTLADYDISPQLHTVEVPVLMICGEFDEAAPKSCKKFADMVPDATNVVVPGAGHATLGQEKDMVIGTIREFLAEKVK